MEEGEYRKVLSEAARDGGVDQDLLENEQLQHEVDEVLDQSFDTDSEGGGDDYESDNEEDEEEDVNAPVKVPVLVNVFGSSVTHDADFSRTSRDILASVQSSCVGMTLQKNSHSRKASSPKNSTTALELKSNTLPNCSTSSPQTGLVGRASPKGR